MPKLTTPVQFESEFDVLNEVKPLILGDEVKSGLAFPIGNLHSVGAGRPAIGKLLRCNEFGALLIEGPTSRADNYEFIREIANSGITVYHIELSQFVKFILIKLEDLLQTTGFALCTPIGLTIRAFELEEWHFVEFRQKTIYYKAFGEEDCDWTINLYGFY